MLKTQLETARHGVVFAKVLERDQEGRTSCVLVPGHEMRQYKVSIQRKGRNFTMHCETPDGELCKGNIHGKVCYHCITALFKTVENQGHVELFQTENIPDVMVQMGRTKITLESLDGGGKLFGVFFKWRQKKNARRKIVPQTLVPTGLGPYDPAIRA